MALAGFHVQIQGLYTTWIYTPWLYIEHMARGYRLILLGRFSPPSESQWMSPNIRPNNIYLKKTQTCLSKFIDLLIHYSAPHFYIYISCLCAYLCDAFIYLSITLCIYVQSLKPFLSMQVFIFIHLYLFIFMYTPHSPRNHDPRFRAPHHFGFSPIFLHWLEQ